PEKAAARPDGARGAAVDVPAVLVAAGLDVVEALRVRDDLGRVQRLAHVLDERGPLIDLPRVEVAGERSAGRGALGGVPGQRAGEGRLGDPGDRDPEIERALHCPAARALLLGLIEDDVGERPTRPGVDVAEHVGRYL